LPSRHGAAKLDPLSVAAEGSNYFADAQTLRLGEDRRATGWLIFAGTLLLVLGCTNIIGGVAAVDGSQVFATKAHYVFGDLDSWGWVIWLIGIAQGLTAVGILVRNQLARWLGVAFALLNALAQLLMIQAFPFWSLALFGLDVLVIYGLLVYGGRTYRPA
jgi:hypothetical protein